MFKRTSALALALCALGATTADAAGPKIARFVAHVSAKQVTTWDVPRFNTYRNCQGQRWHEGGGTETIRWKTKPFRVMATKYAGHTDPYLRLNTWSIFKAPRTTTTPGAGFIERAGRKVYGIDPGECFDSGDPTIEQDGPYDCGRLPFAVAVGLDHRGGQVTVRGDTVHVPTGRGSAGDPYDACPVAAPEGADHSQWNEISQELPARELFDRSQGLTVVLGRKTWMSGIAADHGMATTTTTFTLRMRRKR